MMFHSIAHNYQVKIRTATSAFPNIPAERALPDTTKLRTSSRMCISRDVLKADRTVGLFPDINSEWEGYPSIIDGIRSPYVHLVAGIEGTINLLVTGRESTVSGYGISAPALLHWVADEFEYSVTAHGLPTLKYDGRTYIRRARRSKLLETYDGKFLRAIYPRVQHFAFVGGEDCVELLTYGELTIVPLNSSAARNQWIGHVLEQVREALYI
jgi:hypothetical protein